MSEGLILTQNEDFIVNFTRSLIINIRQYQSVIEDILQQARIAFLKAVRNFNPTKGTTLQEFSKIYIKRDILRFLGKTNKNNQRMKNFTDMNEIYT